MRKFSAALGGICVLFLLLALCSMASPVFADENDVVVSPLMPGEGDEIAAGTGTVTVINKMKICIVSMVDKKVSSMVSIPPNHKAVYKKVVQGRHTLRAMDCSPMWHLLQQKSFNLKKAYSWIVKK